MYLIAGADGQLGQDLSTHLAAGQRSFRALSHRELDICHDPPGAIEWLMATQARVLFNCAAYTQVDRAEVEVDRARQLNAEGPAALALACRRCGARLVHLSSDYVFDGHAGKPYPEEAPTNPLGVYGQSKRDGELRVLAADPRHLVVRTSWLFGVKGTNFVRTILRLAAERHELRIVADQVGAPTSSADLATALVGLVDAEAAGGIYHVTNSGVASWYDLGLAAIEEARQLGWRLLVERVVPVSSAEYPMAAQRPTYSVLSTAKATRVLGAPLDQWRRALRRMLGRLQEAGG